MHQGLARGSTLKTFPYCTNAACGTAKLYLDVEALQPNASDGFSVSTHACLFRPARRGPSAMNQTRVPSPLATARPKNSSSSIASQHAASSSSQTLASMPSTSKIRGTTPTTSRSPAQAGAADGRPGRAASKDSLKQKMAKVAEDPSRPSKADEVRFWTTMEQRLRRLILPSNSEPYVPTSTASVPISHARSVIACSTSPTL